MPSSQTSPIFAAIQGGNLQAFNDLLVRDPKLVLTRDDRGWTLLHFIAALGNRTTQIHSTMADKLIIEGADVNCRTVLGWTPIHMIAMQGQKEAVDVARVLIEAGADLRAIDKHG